MGKKKDKTIKVEITPENKCSFCKGTKCCHYVTQEISTPRSRYEFEHIMWQVLHDGVEVYKDTDKTWYLLMYTTCSKLQPDGRCGIYETRPEICREYSNDWCEYDESAEDHWLVHFKDFDSVNQFGKKRFKNWGKWK
jgi:Fe-S-cluster containining protein